MASAGAPIISATFSTYRSRASWLGAAAGGDRREHARLVQADGVEVSLDEDGHLIPPDGLARTVEREQRLPFLVERRIRRVEILRLALTLEEPAAEADDAAALADRNQQPAAEAIVEARALLARNAETRLLDEGRVDSLERMGLHQRIPEIRRVPQPPGP